MNNNKHAQCKSPTINVHHFYPQTMCKIYYFVNSLTYVASVLLLTAIATERYIAILHPIRLKYLITNRRLTVAMVTNYFEILLR